MTADPQAPGPQAQQGFQVKLPMLGFEGTLGELAAELRAGKVAPEDVPLLQLTGDLLAWLQVGLGPSDMKSDAEPAPLLSGAAPEVLPTLAAVIALKARLLLPKAEAEADDCDDAGEWDSAGADDVASGVALLADLENAVSFLAARRSARTGIIPAPAPKPGLNLPRKARKGPPSRIRLGQLHEAARQAVRDVSSPLLARERLTLSGALDTLRSYALRLGHFLLGGITAANWGERTTYFAALLEAVRLGELQASQEQPFGEITVTTRGLKEG